ncbi:MAG: peptide transporter substrate-binding protein [Thermoleophilia bacterium]|nr:peptide transporter substrate-binding protein [Thermoleophilia bacterium]
MYRVQSLVVLLLAAVVCVVTPSTAAGALAPRSKQVLKVGTTSFTDGGTLDPTQTSYLDTANVQHLAFAPLYRLSSGGTLVPDLASAQPKVSAAGTRITVTLRAGLRWSDGKPLTAADVAYAYARGSKARTRSFFYSFTHNVSKVSAPTPRTLRIDLKRADPILPSMLATTVFVPIPKHVVQAAGARWTAPGKIVSSGPFHLTARTATRFTFMRNSRYHRARSVRLRRVTVTAYGDERRLASALKTGAVNATIQNVLPRTMYSNPPASVTVRQVDTTGHQYAYLNTSNPRLADARVRRALALAIDRASLAGVNQGTPASTLLPENARGGAGIAAGSARALAASGASDVAGSKALLAAANWNPATTLSIYYISDGNSASVAERIQQQWAAVGVKALLTPTAGDAFSTVGIGLSPTRTNVDVVLQGWIQDYADPSNFYQLVTCASRATGLNTANYCDASYDAEFAKVATVFSFPERLKTFIELERMLTGAEGAFPAIPLYRQSDKLAVRTTVRGYTATTYGDIYYDGVSIHTR